MNSTVKCYFGRKFSINNKCNTSGYRTSKHVTVVTGAGDVPGDGDPGGGGLGQLALVPVELRVGLVAEVGHPVQGPVRGTGGGSSRQFW